MAYSSGLYKVAFRLNKFLIEAMMLPISNDGRLVENSELLLTPLQTLHQLLRRNAFHSNGYTQGSNHQQSEQSICTVLMKMYIYYVNIKFPP